MKRNKRRIKLEDGLYLNIVRQPNGIFTAYHITASNDYETTPHRRVVVYNDDGGELEFFMRSDV